MNSSEIKYLHCLNLLPQFGPARLAVLYKKFGGYEPAYKASAGQLLKAGLDEKIITAFLNLRGKINPDSEMQILNQHQIKILTNFDKNYSKLLSEIAKPPPILYYRGKLEEPEELAVAVVGTRRITNYGRAIINELVEPLCQAGLTIVSGMAFGVDELAHQIAVKQNLRTIAVLGGGLDEKSLYPKHHALLAEQILTAGGALVSEYPIGTPNFKQNFVARNRIISGLCVATIVVECDLKSGTLITAKYALEQNRQVYAVPGPIYSPQSQGPNNLLKMGAKPLTEANDVLEDLNLKTLPEQTKAKKQFADSQEENILLQLIKRDPIGVNELIKTSGLGTAAVTSTLTFLEMKGKIRNLGGQQYVISR